MKTTLPDDIVEELQDARDEDDRTPLFSLVRALKDAGWTFEDIATPLGVTRSAVNQWHKNAVKKNIKPASLRATDYPVYDPVGTPKRIKPDVPPRDREKLRDLAARARANTRWSAPNSPERRAAEELTRLLDLHINQRKVSVAAVARHTGVTRRAIMQRLERLTEEESRH